MTTYVKELLPNGKSPLQNYPWPLPSQKLDGAWKPGKWVKIDNAYPLKYCGHGLHAYTEAQAQSSLRHDRVYYEIEYATAPKDWSEKVSGYKARLLRPYPVPAWLSTVQPAIDTLKGIQWFKPDDQPVLTWKLFPTRAYAWDAAWDAAGAVPWAAAGDAAWDAARAAAWDAAWDAARAAAWDAARAAAWDAARAAAWDAARAAARDAAGDAAGDAAWDAARDAAGDAAGAAARDAAGDAAGAAALWVLMSTVCADLPITQEYRDHTEARMNVWRKGYGLLCDVDGVLYVYETVS